MKRAILGCWVMVSAGCIGGGSDGVARHEEAVRASATQSDVDDLGIDDAGCSAPDHPGGTGVPVDGRPDLLAVAIEGQIVCVTTVAAAAEVDAPWLADVRAQLGEPMSNDDDDEPQPEPYVSDDDKHHPDEEPQPEPYDGGKTTGGDGSSDSPDSE